MNLKQLLRHAAIALPLTAGCAINPSIPQSQADFVRYASASVNQVPFRDAVAKNEYGVPYDTIWRILSDSQVVLWADKDTPYLITTDKNCELLGSRHVFVISAHAYLIKVGVDRIVRTTDWGNGSERCLISQIQPIDYLRMRADGLPLGPSVTGSVVF